MKAKKGLRSHEHIPHKAPDEPFQDVHRYGKKRRTKESCGRNREDSRIFTGSLSSPHPRGRVQMPGDHSQGYRDGYLSDQISMRTSLPNNHT